MSHSFKIIFQFFSVLVLKLFLKCSNIFFVYNERRPPTRWTDDLGNGCVKQSASRAIPAGGVGIFEETPCAALDVYPLK